MWIYPSFHNHGSGKWQSLKGNYYWQGSIFFTSMTMGRVRHGNLQMSGEWPWYSRGPPVDSYRRYRDAWGLNSRSRTLELRCFNLQLRCVGRCGDLVAQTSVHQKIGATSMDLFFWQGILRFCWPNIHCYPVFWQDPSYMLYLKVKIDGLPIPKGRLVKVKGPYEPICRDG